MRHSSHIRVLTVRHAGRPCCPAAAQPEEQQAAFLGCGGGCSSVMPPAGAGGGADLGSLLHCSTASQSVMSVWVARLVCLIQNGLITVMLTMQAPAV